MRVLVTGGAGYLGSTVVHHLLNRGVDVRVVDVLHRGGHSLLSACRSVNFEIVVGDLRDPAVCADVMTDCDAVIHLAALVGTPACDAAPGLAREVNLDATIRLLDAKRPEQRFVFASTASVYGAVPSGFVDEETEPRPGTVYGQTKLAAEGAVRSADNCVVMRLATVFGVSRAQRWDLLVNDLTFKAVTRRRIRLFQPEAQRTFVHVNDVGRALCLPLFASGFVSGSVYNVGDPESSITKRQLARLICDETGADLETDEIGKDPDERDYTMSFDKIRSVGFTAGYSLLAGVRELVKAASLASPEPSKSL